MLTESNARGKLVLDACRSAGRARAPHGGTGVPPVIACGVAGHRCDACADLDRLRRSYHVLCFRHDWRRTDTTVKTAISLDSALFEEAETLAVRMRISRSRLLGMVLGEFIRRHRSRANEVVYRLRAIPCDWPRFTPLALGPPDEPAAAGPT